MQLRTVALAAALTAAPGLLYAQFDFHLAGRDVQVHSFASQGFGYSNNNNFLTMKTSDGTFAMTDGGVNISTQLTDKFRVGAQVYDHNIGNLGKWHPTLDWAVADFRVKDWFGIRAGKVKTVMGLYTDSQDAEFLHTWALLPQSVYPTDLRATTNAHTGGDVYGAISLRSAGTLNYTGYWGTRAVDEYGGQFYALRDSGMPTSSWTARMAGTDLRWNTPVNGLVVGYSWGLLTQDVKGAYKKTKMTYEASSDPQHVSAYYAEYAIGKWHLATEFRRNYSIMRFTLPVATSLSDTSENEWFGSVAYRVAKRLELGAYNSRYYGKAAVVGDPASDHLFDQAATARVDLSRFCALKVEGHFMDGYGNPYSSHGFYASTNTAGLKPTTNMLVVRLGFGF